MATQEKAIEELQAVSGQVSDRIRTLAIGIVGVWWALLVGEADKSPIEPKAMLGPVLLSAVSLVLDYLQYLAGYRNNLEALNAAEAADVAAAKKEEENARAQNRPVVVLPKTDVEYDPSSGLYRFRSICFNAKQAAAAVGIVWFLAVLVKSLP